MYACMCAQHSTYLVHTYMYDHAGIAKYICRNYQRKMVSLLNFSRNLSLDNNLTKLHKCSFIACNSWSCVKHLFIAYTSSSQTQMVVGIRAAYYPCPLNIQNF